VEKPSISSGIIGSGFAASFHFEAVQRVYGVKVENLGVYSPNHKHAETFAEKRHLNTWTDLASLLKASDVVHVCTPPHVHEEIVIAALESGTHAIVEKPMTGFFGDGSETFNGSIAPKQEALVQAVASIQRMRAAETNSTGRILYAENWVYAPSIQKEREIIEKTGAQILWMHGEEAHSGSHSRAYGFWKFAGGGAMIGKGCHPLTAALYLKRVEGYTRNGIPIRPTSVSARTHIITRMPSYIDLGHLRTDYHDIEDLALAHVTFQDGSVCDIFSSEIIMGGIHNWLEVVANNHRTICSINPNNQMETYNPVDSAFEDIYVVEKIGTKQGWTSPSPDEDHSNGFPQEMEAFYRTAAYGDSLQSDSSLAADAITTIYAGYVSAEQKGAEVQIPIID
tara:strand:- start:887 stop:2071 length:1185 start_codon:yes stop_codon:yes gene_type:complete